MKRRDTVVTLRLCNWRIKIGYELRKIFLEKVRYHVGPEVVMSYISSRRKNSSTEKFPAYIKVWRREGA